MAEKRLAVVTGAARGIGRAIVLELLKQGRIVAGLDINAEQLEELEGLVEDAGFSVITRCVDITDSEKLTGILEALADEHGGIGILVNNAGITRDALLMRMSDEDFDRVLQVNLRAAFVATRTAAKSMRELAKKNVTANCLAPGFIVSDMTDKLPEPVQEAAKQLIPMRKFGTVEDVARAAAFFASDEAGYITGQVLCIDGGMAM